MHDFLTRVLTTKKISVWGIGYLGYTIALRLQENGFFPVLHDFSLSRLDELGRGLYPNEEQNSSWTKSGKIPLLDMDKAVVCREYAAMFENSIHIISFPSTDQQDYVKLSDIFIQNRQHLENALVVFQSAGVPGSIDEDFTRRLQDEEIAVSIASVFRSDWIIEDFLANIKQRVVAANTPEALKKTQRFLQLLHLESVSLQSIEEAEVYENTKKSLAFTVTAFFNQLALSYPDINIGEMMKRLLSDMDLHDLSIGVSSIDYKSEQAISHLMSGAESQYLSILKEAATANISFLFYYIEMLKQKGVSSVTILGLSSYSSLKDIRFSPSIILAELLDKAGMAVHAHDQNFTPNEIEKILPFAHCLDYNKEAISTDAVVVMSLCDEYRFFTQERLEAIGFCDVRYILDNTGFFKDYNCKSAVYHAFGDGNLPKVIV